MPLIPTLRLVVLALAPLLLGIGMAIDASFLRPMLAADAGLVLLALLDGLLASGRLVAVTRESPAVLSVGRANPIRLQDPIAGAAPAGRQRHRRSARRRGRREPARPRDAGRRAAARPSSIT